MAKINKGILGPFSGKIGPIIGSSWKNIPYIKAAPLTTGNQKTFSPAQLANQERFKRMNDFLEPFHPYITIGFANLATLRTEINMAFKINYHEAMEQVGETFEMRYDKVCLSRGNLPGLEAVQVIRSTNEIALSWQPYSAFAQTNDQVMLVVYCSDLKIADGFVGLAMRRDASLTVTLQPKMANQPLELYLSMVSLNRKRVSNSQYLGRVWP